MKQTLTFLHTADLHLGAPLRGLRALSEQWAQRLLTAIAESYERVVDTALENKVDFVVIAGDVFDSSRVSYGDYRLFFKGLERLRDANIPVYLCTGNHDPYTSWQNDLYALPSNAFMLPASKPGFFLYRRGMRFDEGSDASASSGAPASGPTSAAANEDAAAAASSFAPMCLIGGRGFYSQAWSVDEDIAAGITREAALAALQESAPDAAQAPFAVGVLHTGLDVDLQKAPCDPKELYASGMDYWALGHLHRRRFYPSEDNPRACFSGCIQGRDIKETGERGCFLVTLAQDEISQVEFVPTASVVWEKLEVDVGECATVSEISDMIMRALFRANGKARCEKMCVRITLTGATPLHDLLARPGVVEDLRQHINDSYPEFFCDALIDNTRRVLDKGALRQEGLFPSVFLNTARAHRSNVADEVAYLQEEFLNKGMPLPASCVKSVDSLAAKAEDLVLDLLQSDEVRS